MNIIEMNIDELIPYENNPRNNEEAIDKVAESIKQFGFKVPIIVDADNIIVAGHTRLLAAKKLNMELVPVTVANDLTEEQVKAFRLADNKVSEFSEWNSELLLAELEELNMDMNEFGFDELEKIEFEPDEEEDTSSVDLEENVVIVIEEDTEEKLEKTFTKLMEEGYECRLLTL